ncbi:MAG: ribonuclease E inhibitor RraB [Planctomycetaceae bacterium]
MAEKQSIKFDIDALFRERFEQLDQPFDDEQDWIFSFRSDDLQLLEDVAEELDGEFEVDIAESVEQFDEDGNPVSGPPMLAVIRQAALTADEVKAIAQRMADIAAERGLVYEGVGCYDPVDTDELFGWLDPDEAPWRLRHMTDIGLPENAELPVVFLIATSSLESMKQVADQLDASGFKDRDEYDEPDEEGEYGLCVFTTGRNNEAELVATTTEISGIAEHHQGRLEGIQFYTREDLAHVFGVDDEA